MSSSDAPVGVPKVLLKSQKVTQKLWNKVIDRALEFGFNLETDEWSFAKDNIPKEVEKMSYFTDLLTLMDRFDPFEHNIRSTIEWLDLLKAKGVSHIGKAKFRRRKDWSAARVKQSGLYKGRARPTFTRLAENYDIDDIMHQLEGIRGQIAKLDWGNSLFKEEYTEDWSKILNMYGSFNPAFLIGHLAAMASSDLPWSRGDSPLPQRALNVGIKHVLENEAGFGPSAPKLKPAHLLNGTMGSGSDYEGGTGTIRNSNPEGAAGHPFTRDDKARDLTSDGRRPVKRNVAQHDHEILEEWFLAGLPMSGTLFEKVSQPTTMWYRGDATVNVNLLALAFAMLSKGDPLLLWMLGGRGIAIVPSILVTLESMIYQPFQDSLAKRDNKGYDLRTVQFTRKRMAGMVKSTSATGTNLIGIDVARWDLNMVAQAHATKAALMMHMFEPGEHSILIGAATYGAVWSDNLVREILQSLPVGESAEVTVEVPDPEGGMSFTEAVRVTHLKLDVRSFIPKLISMVNSTVAYGDYEFVGPLVKHEVPDIYGEFDRRYYVETRGGQRSGSGGTSANNTSINGTDTVGGYEVLTNIRQYRGLIQRIGKAYNLPIPVRSTGGFIESLKRGDDQVVRDDLILYADGNKVIPDGLKATWLMAMSGRYANADKQEASGIPGVAKVGFASKDYDSVSPEGSTRYDRAGARSITTESKGIPPSELTQQSESERELDLGRVSTTLTAQARILNLRGGPKGNAVPGNEMFISAIADLDDEGLTYGLSAKSDGDLTNYIEAMAARYAQRQGAKHGKVGKQARDEDYEEYLGADIHRFLRENWLTRSKRTSLKRIKGGADAWFDKIVNRISRTSDEEE